jgi:hypothetical protein
MNQGWHDYPSRLLSGAGVKPKGHRLDILEFR